MKKKLMTVLALVLVIAMSVAGTVAYLTHITAPITNTFTVGNIDIGLAETMTDFKMVPGCDIAKDPVVTVDANSEDCWLFVKIDESENLDSFISYAVANGWTQGDGTNIPANVWYRAVAKDATVKSFHLLANDTVTIDSTAVTNDNMNDAANAELVYTAYACQKDNMSVEAAWAHFTTP